ncbi:MAG: hypothetical protein K6G85_09040, partial [Eubacterium sp.]|nr:hypothetical protein [Eubacterium sp.]
YIVQLTNENLYELFLFNPYEIMRGQVWRLFTWILTAPDSLGIFTIVMLFLYYSLGTALEKTWGTFQYNLFLLSGFVFTIIGATVIFFIYAIYYSNSEYGVMYNAHVAELMGLYVSAMVSTFYINMSIFLAFAVTYPDVELLLYFVIPVKIKWFGYLYGAFIAYDIFSSFKNAGGQTFIAVIHTVIVLVSLLNFFIYWISGWGKTGSHIKRSHTYKKSIRSGQKERTYSNGAKHKCYICGRTDLDYPELTFRYCSKCSGGKEYCQDHLFTHTHQ